METEERGFVNSSEPRSMTDALCSGSSVVFPTVNQRTINRTLAVISRQVSREAADNYCGDRNAIMSRMRNPSGNTPLPALTPPPGMSSQGAGSTGTADRGQTMTTETSLEGDLPVSDIATHYWRLFTIAGWRESDRAVTASLSAITFEITGTDGARWHCALVVSRPARGIANVTLLLRQVL